MDKKLVWDPRATIANNPIVLMGGPYTATELMNCFSFVRSMANAAIKDVIFNDPATIVFWSDGTKTVVKASNEPFDPEKGLAMAIAKKTYGNKGNYYNEIRKWLGKYGKPNEAAIKPSERLHQ